MTPNPNPSPELRRDLIQRLRVHLANWGTDSVGEHGNAKIRMILAFMDAEAALSPQTLPAPGEVPQGMKAWAGGDSAPDDWDGGPVKARNGKTVYTPAYWQHRPEPEWSGQWDIVAYTSTLATVAAANDEGLHSVIRKWRHEFAPNTTGEQHDALFAAIRLLPQGGGKA